MRQIESGRFNESQGESEEEKPGKVDNRDGERKR